VRGGVGTVSREWAEARATSKCLVLGGGWGVPPRMPGPRPTTSLTRPSLRAAEWGTGNETMTTEEMRRLVESLGESDLERLVDAVEDERNERQRLALAQVRRSLTLGMVGV
jgi:hypothetical protein